jgi:hypothetical protein
MLSTSSWDLLLWFAGVTAGVLVFAGCGLMFLCLRFDPPRSAAGKGEKSDEPAPRLMAQALAIGLGSGLLAVTSLWWAGLHLAHNLRPDGARGSRRHAAPRSGSLFPWE